MSNIMVIGLGYVGTALSVALAKNNNVLALDINKDKVNLLNKGVSSVKDNRISEYLDSRRLDLRAEVYGNLEN